MFPTRTPQFISFCRRSRHIYAKTPHLLFSTKIIPTLFFIYIISQVLFKMGTTINKLLPKELESILNKSPAISVAPHAKKRPHKECAAAVLGVFIVSVSILLNYPTNMCTISSMIPPALVTILITPLAIPAPSAFSDAVTILTTASPMLLRCSMKFTPSSIINHPDNFH